MPAAENEEMAALAQLSPVISMGVSNTAEINGESCACAAGL